jgi:rhodanese-related sulfurtransferase
MIAASWLTAAGFDDVSDLMGGYGAWAQMQVLDAVSAR